MPARRHSVFVLSALGLAGATSIGCAQDSLSVSESQGADLAFERACTPGDTVTIAAVGDLLLHNPQHARAQRTVRDLADVPADERGEVGYYELLRDARDAFEAADLVIGNMEVPLARDIAFDYADRCPEREISGDRFFDGGEIYSGTFPIFNTHPSFAIAAAAAGFDVLTTANNHALDRCSIGIDRTVAALGFAGIDHVGTVTRSEANPEGDAYVPETERYIVREVNGMRIAILSYTYAELNGLVDRRGQVNVIEDGRIVDTIEAARNDGVDAVVVALHWGVEYSEGPSDAQMTLARELIDAGANVVLGGHPHVLHPMERHVAPDGHEGLIVYSLGNFLSAQTWSMPVRAGAVVYVGLTLTASGALVNGVRYRPTTIVDSAVSVCDQGPECSATANYVSDILGWLDPDEDGVSDLLYLGEGPLRTNPTCGARVTPTGERSEAR